MPHHLKWKVCGLTSAENMRAVARLHPNWMGMIFYAGSPRSADPAALEAVCAQLPEGIQKVGVFVNETPERMLHLARLLGLDVLQLHGDESPNVAARCREQGMDVWKAIRIEPDFDWKRLEAYADSCSHFVFDTPTLHFGGSGQKFNWGLLDDYSGSVPFLLSGGLSETDVAAVRRLSHPKLVGIDVNSRMEDAPGLKNTARLRALAQNLNDDD